ncbi:hypothetical protein [Natranaerofaba carboxydovora]|uniref:hypothetical protein n=1 Tax=Natranaerofaba carboxydovora TaxID=2742683 RepID=UPI001F145AB4|nr:hypothetical protein [Natranaerofaba carboxydovora]
MDDIKGCSGAGFNLKVRLDDNGEEATALVGGCTLCMNSLQKGSKVKLVKLKEGYVVAQSPMDKLKDKKCDSIEKTV